MLNIPRYRVETLLYESRNSLIYQGHRAQDGLPVILKILNEDAPSPERRARFQQEYLLMQKLPLDGILRAYALESHQGMQIMVLEDFGGISLNNLQIATCLPVNEWLPLAIRITECLGQAHQHHIMHKDINPSNIVWNRETGQVKLIDFGIATELSRESPEIRNPDCLEGTLFYLSPEQTGRMNRALDYRTDFYSLGVTFYELLTGQLPFPGDDVLELVHAHMAKTPVPAHQINPAIPPALAAIVGKLMEKTAEERYQSTAGLLADLQTCRSALERHGRIEAFPLGREDFSERLQIPQKLYGRETQIATLLQAFERTSRGQTELLLIAGYSGIGKSALVHEVQKPITQHRGYFIEGKFDQFKRDIPYASLVQAFKELIRQLLTEGEGGVKQWKEKLLLTLGNNAQVIIDVIPDVELIVGPQPAVPELPPAQAQNRFNHEFRKFVAAFATAKHPLVIFLDDLQWADLPSLQLMSLLLRPSATSHLLLIGAYRSNEVTATHALPLTLTEMEKNGTAMHTIALPPLTIDEVNILLCDTLRSDAPHVEELGRLCMAKTQGNPFFLNQFLGALASQDILHLDIARGTWQWDVAHIREAGITDNVVDLMVSRLQKLPPAAQRVLQGAACLGNEFDLQTLAIVCELAKIDTADLLWNALLEELIIPLDDHYKYVGQSFSGDAQGLVPSYRFLHDRVQQAAYLLGGDAEKSAMHLTIGRLWLKSFSPARQQEVLFDLTNHLNLGRHLMTAATEQHHLAQLNLSAARKAKASAAYKPSLRYLQTALELVHVDDWNEHYDFMFALYLAAAEAAYLSLEFAQMDDYMETALRHAANVLDQAKVYDIRIQAYTSAGKFRESVLTGLEVLALLGVPFPKDPKRIHTLLSLVQTKLALSGKRIEDLAHLPKMHDPHTLAAVHILIKIMSAAYYSLPAYLPLILFKVLRLSVKYGNAPTSAFAYASYGGVLCGMLGDIERGSQYGELALKLLERPGLNAYKNRAMFVTHLLVQPWKKSLHEIVQPLIQDYLYSIEIGDMEFSANGVNSYCIYSFYSGLELTSLEKATADYHNAIQDIQQHPQLITMKILGQTILNLQGKSPDHSSLQGMVCDLQEMESRLLSEGDHMVLFRLFSNRLVLSYIFRNYREGLQNAIEAEKYVKSRIGFFGAGILSFYGALTRLALLASSPLSERMRLLRKIKKDRKKLRHWALHAPANFLHKWHLVEAEIARCSGKPLKAADAYEQAIRAAKENNFLHEEALAQELAGRFYYARDQEFLAKTHLGEAQRLYRCWGALAKVQELAQHYPQWLQNKESAQTPRALDHHTVSITNTSTSGTLDFATAMKASQALSQEIVLEHLLKRLMQVAIENAGAQRGVLLLKKDARWFIEAEKTDDQAEAMVLQSIPLVESTDALLLPLSLVHYVMHTRKSMVIHEAAKEKLVANDPYVQQHHPRSLLIIPILHHAEMTGILYLENNVLSDAFTESRLEVLHLLASQTAISIENARLYSDMEDRVAARTAELKAMSLRDGLTGVANRKAFDERLADEMAIVRRSGRPLALLIIDIDHFKQVNDTYGHLAGDECLRRIGATLTALPHRSNDFIARYGGEEFAVLLPDTNLAGATDFAERVLDTVRTIVLEIGELRHPITASLGIAVATAAVNADPVSLIACADQRLYAAKAAGRNRFVHAEFS